MLCSCLEASLPVLLPNGIAKERHQEAHLGRNTAIRQRWCDVVANQNHLLIFLFSIRIVCADGPLSLLSQLSIDMPSETFIKNIIVPLIASDIDAETTMVPMYLNKNGSSNKKDTKMDKTYTTNQSL